MKRLARALTAGLLLASVSAASVRPEPEVCVADEQTPCARSLEDNLVVGAPEQEPTAAADNASADQAAIATRPVGPPTVVDPFSSVAAPQSIEITERVVRTAPADQKLPPGPPNRYP